MSKSKPDQFTRIGKRYAPAVVNQQITSYSVNFRNKNIRDWQRFINSAWSELVPNRVPLIELYDNICIDGHLESVMEKRRNAILNRKVEFIPKGTDETPENIEEFVTGTPWFRDLLKSMLKSVAYGFSLTELVPKGGFIQEVIDIDRRNIIPEWDALLWDQHHRSDGINFLSDPKYSKYLIFSGGRKSYGKLMIAAMYIIYKRGGLADWAQFIELYGMPIKEGRYDAFDDNQRRKLEDAMKNMGAAAHIVLPKGAEFQLHQVTQSGTTTTQKDLLEFCNAEISKLFLGNTLTTEQGNKGARSLGEVHQDVEEGVNTADAIEIEYKLNWELAEKLRQIGYPIPQGQFRLPVTREIKLEDRIKIDKDIHDRMPLSEQYWIETYGVHPDKDVKIRVPKTMIPIDEEAVEADTNPTSSKKKERIQARGLSKIQALYHGACDRCEHGVTMALDPKVFDDIWDRLAKQIHSGERPLIDEDLLRATADQLVSGVTDGLAIDGGDAKGLAKQLTQNVQVFSGFKTFTQLQEATTLLLDQAGAVKPFGAFLTDVRKMSEEYNVNYLKAEYNHAVASAQMANAWRKTDSNDMITYLTAADERVRETHRAMEGVTKQRKDPFWGMYWPPNGWGCRCTAIVTATGNETPDEEIDAPEIPDMFRHNPGTDGVIFPDTHPYFDVAKNRASEIKRETRKALK